MFSFRSAVQLLVMIRAINGAAASVLPPGAVRGSTRRWPRGWPAAAGRRLSAQAFVEFALTLTVDRKSVV